MSKFRSLVTLVRPWKVLTNSDFSRNVGILSQVPGKYYQQVVTNGCCHQIRKQHYSQWRNKFQLVPPTALFWNLETKLVDLVCRQQQQRSASNSTASINGSNKTNKAGEVKIKSILEKAFSTANKIIVEDISGGCGSMYQVYVESLAFEGLSIVKQHQLVNKALAAEIKIMHGIRIETKVAK